MVARKFVVVVASLAFAVLATACSKDGRSPTGPSGGPTVTVATVAPVLPLLGDNGNPIGSTITIEQSIVSNVAYSVSNAATMGQLAVVGCTRGPVEGTALMTSCDTNGYRADGKDQLFVSLRDVRPDQRPKEINGLVFFITRGSPRTLTPDKAIPPNSGNYRITDVFDVVQVADLPTTITVIP